MVASHAERAALRDGRLALLVLASCPSLGMESGIGRAVSLDSLRSVAFSLCARVSKFSEGVVVFPFSVVLSRGTFSVGFSLRS